MSCDAPISAEHWDDDGTEEYWTMFARIERDGMILETECDPESKEGG